MASPSISTKTKMADVGSAKVALLCSLYWVSSPWKGLQTPCHLLGDFLIDGSILTVHFCLGSTNTTNCYHALISCWLKDWDPSIFGMLSWLAWVLEAMAIHLKLWPDNFPVMQTYCVATDCVSTWLADDSSHLWTWRGRSSYFWSVCAACVCTLQ